VRARISVRGYGFSMAWILSLPSVLLNHAPFSFQFKREWLPFVTYQLDSILSQRRQDLCTEWTAFFSRYTFTVMLQLHLFVVHKIALQNVFPLSSTFYCTYSGSCGTSIRAEPHVLLRKRAKILHVLCKGASSMFLQQEPYIILHQALPPFR
jgi:hypothetical protein